MKYVMQSLEKLINSYAISGYEWELNITNTIQELVGSPCERIGNNLIYSIGKGEKNIFISAHMDEVGFFITKSNKNFYKILPIGTIDIKDVIGERLIFFYKNKHYTSEQIQQAKSFSDLAIEIKGQLPVGSIGTFEKRTFINNKIITSPSLDNKTGCLVLIELIKFLSEPDIKDCRYIFCFASREESGGNGLMTALAASNPNICIDIDSAYAKPLLGKENDNWAIPEIGKGPAIQLQGKGFMISSDIRRFIERIAEKNNISYQYEIPSIDAGGTNAEAILNKGLEVMQINIPVANQHSAKSTTSIKDIQSTIQLLKPILLDLPNSNLC